MAIVKMIMVLIAVVCLILITFKLSETRLNKMRNGNYIKVIERTQITKNNTIILIKAGKKGYLINCSNDKSEVLKEISEDEILLIEKEKQDIKNNMAIDVNNKLLQIKDKLKSLKLRGKN
ncbi:flagellar formation protein [Clostridium fallax]|uniref:Flagellar protein FliO/FliZ n=1 Tax=Clostridium fallax TaxID=1533 RepID=A0A1M4UJ02_9CLOT|nr:flagellar protein FliO/FliZ [Clostridium fallax]SQB07594.1 flagellar formation protein [Clostridium fallax]